MAKTLKIKKEDHILQEQIQKVTSTHTFMKQPPVAGMVQVPGSSLEQDRQGPCCLVAPAGQETVNKEAYKPARQFQIMISIAVAAARSLQSCLTLCDPKDGSPPGSPVPGILQARTLEWVAISFSMISFCKNIL